VKRWFFAWILMLCAGSFAVFGCKDERQIGLAIPGKGGYTCRLHIEGKQPMSEAVAIFRQRLKKANLTQSVVKEMPARRLHLEVAKIKVTPAIRLLLQAQGRLGIHSFVEDLKPLHQAYLALPQAAQKHLQMGPSLRALQLLAQSSSRPTTQPPASQPSTAPTPQGKATSIFHQTPAEQEGLHGEGHHIFFGTLRSEIERSLAQLALPKALRSQSRFVWQRSASQRFWKVFLVAEPSAVQTEDLAHVSNFHTEHSFLGLQLVIRLRPDAAERFAILTRRLLKKPLAIVLDDQLYISPIIQEVVQSGVLYLSPPIEIPREQRDDIARAWQIILSTPALAKPPTLEWIKSLRSF
jgi:preprotein translocase subunit SecD